jgi:cystathionine beta-lyase/cystathionine gamma-synthase
MKIRLIKLHILTKKIINYLQEKKIKIIHPYLLDHISNPLAVKYFNLKLFISTFLIEINKNIEEISLLLNNLEFTSVSFGGCLTKIDKNIFSENNKNYIRLSIGYNDNYDNLVLKINQIIKN